MDDKELHKELIDLAWCIYLALHGRSQEWWDKQSPALGEIFERSRRICERIMPEAYTEIEEAA